MHNGAASGFVGSEVRDRRSLVSLTEYGKFRENMTIRAARDITTDVYEVIYGNATDASDNGS